MSRLVLWLAIAQPTRLIFPLLLLAIIGFGLYCLRMGAAKVAEYRKQLEPIPKPSYEPRLFGVPMEWDPETGFWWAEFGCIEVDLYEVGHRKQVGNLTSFSGSSGFICHIEESFEAEIETLEGATAALEEELTRIRNAIPIATRANTWSDP